MFEIRGLDELQRKLSDLGGKARSMHGEHNVSFDELFSPDFMQRHTDFATLDDLFEASGFVVEDQEDFEAIPDDEWDQFIAGRTSFANWLEMLQEAAGAWMLKGLGLS